MLDTTQATDFGLLPVRMTDVTPVEDNGPLPFSQYAALIGRRDVACALAHLTAAQALLRKLPAGMPAAAVYALDDVDDALQMVVDRAELCRLALSVVVAP